MDIGEHMVAVMLKKAEQVIACFTRTQPIDAWQIQRCRTLRNTRMVIVADGRTDLGSNCGPQIQTPLKSRLMQRQEVNNNPC